MSRKPDPKKAAIGARIAAAREKVGLKQSVFARMLGVTPSNVSQWEGGLTMPSRERFYLIPGLLKVSAEWLLTGENEEEKGKAQDYVELEMLRLARMLDWKGAVHIIQEMQSLVQDSSVVDDEKTYLQAKKDNARETVQAGKPRARRVSNLNNPNTKLAKVQKKISARALTERNLKKILSDARGAKLENA